MATLNISKTRILLQEFKFHQLFIEELGWSQPSSKKPIQVKDSVSEYPCKQIAQLSGVVVFEVELPDDIIPNAKSRAEIYKQTSKLHLENLLLFVNKSRTKSLWYWQKREGNKRFPRDHYYLKGQPGDLFLAKLSAMVVDISELDDDGEMSVLEIANRLKNALDVEATTKKFFGEYDDLRIQFVELIEGIKDERKRKWYASVLLNRLMFIYFLQEKFFLDGGNRDYLQTKLNESKKRGKDQFYNSFLKILFFEGFAKPEKERSEKTNKLLGSIKYLNGGLFLPHSIELAHTKIDVPDKAFENLFSLFRSYSWNLNDTPGGLDNEINPDTLGYIFEKYINQKEFGAYYTRPEITEYLSERSISKLIVGRVNAKKISGINVEYDSLSDLLLNLNAPVCKVLLGEILPSINILDPACGSGAFLVAAMKTLINVYSAVVGKIEFVNDNYLSKWLKDAHSKHRSINYFIKKEIITNNLYGVDIMEEATEIAKLRLFLALVAAAQTVDDLEPLPNVDFNILVGNSLIGLMHVDEKVVNKNKSQDSLFGESYRQQLAEKNRLIQIYRNTSSLGAEDLRDLRETIKEKKAKSIDILNGILLDEFAELGVKYEEATWDEKEKDLGKPKKRPLKIKDIEALTPFHWGYEFDEIFEKNEGFDIILTNPPWEILKPQAKELFANHSELVTKKRMDIKSFEKEMAKLLKDEDIREAWLDYLNQFPHVSAYYRSSPQYKNQISIVDGKKAGSDINLYKLFVEQCYHLLKPGGDCGIVIPSGIYTDLGAKQLREMLLSQTNITGLFCFENRKEIFESVHRSFKIVILTFEKGMATKSFPAAFMRLDPSELIRFPSEDSLLISVDLIRKLSPDSMSIMEFKSPIEIQIASKMFKHPMLGEDVEGVWKLKLTAEFHMTNDSYLFKTDSAEGRLPLFEGKMIHHFTHQFAEGRYWVDEKKARISLLGRNEKDTGQTIDYQNYRLGIRAIARNTDVRTIIAGPIPRNVFCGNSLLVDSGSSIDDAGKLTLQAMLNSFTLDYFMRLKVSANINMFYIYQLPVPRLTKKDKWFAPIVERSAKLICTTDEFDALAKSVGLGNYKKGVRDEDKRAQLRAELDGIVAHLYGLTEEEFAYILTTFPIVPDPIKNAAHNAFRDVDKGIIK